MRVFYSPYAFWLWTHQDKEKDEELFFESFLNEGDTVVDCGAHIGTLTITAAKVVKEQGRVFAFEAHPRTFSYLLKNLIIPPHALTIRTHLYPTPTFTPRWTH